MSHNLPESLVAMIRERITDPRRRHFRNDIESLGMRSDPDAIRALFEQSAPGSSAGFDMILEQMKRWGQDMPAMHLSQNLDGMISASTDDPSAMPLAAPATAETLSAVETAISMPLPRDLSEMWGIADGGWGPGVSHTIGHGPGLLSAKGCIDELADLKRRGPGYTGEMSWPDSLLPLTDTGRGMTSYDLDTGHIVTFDDYWYDRDIAIEDAFSVVHLSLAEFLHEWVES